MGNGLRFAAETVITEGDVKQRKHGAQWEDLLCKLYVYTMGAGTKGAFPTAKNCGILLKK